MIDFKQFSLIILLTMGLIGKVDCQSLDTEKTYHLSKHGHTTHSITPKRKYTHHQWIKRGRLKNAAK